MRQASEAFRNRLASGHTTLVKLWHIIIPCKGDLRFTDCTQDLMFEGQLWKARPGIEITAIRKTVLEGFNDAEVKFGLSEDGITESQVRYNELNGVKFYIYAVHADALNLGKMELFAGRLGNAVIEGEIARQKAFGGIQDQADLNIGQVFSERCRNVVYDSNCKANPAEHRIRFMVTGVKPDGSFTVNYQLPTPEELDPNENTDVLGKIKETKLTVSGSYTVPPTAVKLGVLVVAGGAGMSFGRTHITFNETNVYPGTAGGNSMFDTRANGLRIEATGGNIGSFLASYNGGGGQQITVRFSSKAGENGKGLNGISGNFPSSAAQYNSQDLPLDGVYFRSYAPGGNGGTSARELVVGVDVQVGDVIPYVIGERGTSPNVFGPVAAEAQPGYIQINEIGVIETIVNAKSDTNWDYGRVQWVKGDNICRKSLIRSIEGNTVTLLAHTARPIQVGDEGFYMPGCTNYRSYCMSKFNNLPNFRGEPDVPNIAAPVTIPANTTIPEPEPVAVTNPYTGNNYLPG